MPLVDVRPHWHQRLLRPGRLPRVASSQNVGTTVIPNLFGGLLRLAVEIAFGAVITNDSTTWLWTDVTADVLVGDNQFIEWALGQRDESGVSAPATVACVLDDRGNKYNPYNPFATNWPNVVRNTPVRVRLSTDGGLTWWVKWQGQADGFTPAWDATGNYAVVKVSASGRLRQLQQGDDPLRSALERSIIGANPVVYWPGEDSTAATQAGAATNNTPALVTGSGPVQAGAVAFGNGDAPGGSAPIVNFSGGGFLTALFPTRTNTGQWAVEFVMEFIDHTGKVFDSTVTRTIAIMWYSPGATYPYNYMEVYPPEDPSFPSEVDLFLTPTATATGINPCTIPSFNVYDGKPHLFKITGSQSGGTANFEIWVDGVLKTTGSGTATLTPPTGLWVNWGDLVSAGTANKPGTGMVSSGHWAIWDSKTVPDHYPAFSGYAGETPQARISRLCSEESVPFSTVGFYATSVRMGPQRVDTLINLLREAELTDAGFLYDGAGAGLTYQGISQRYDQATAMTLDATASEFMAPFAPIDDDYLDRNKVKVDRVNGSSATFEQVTGPLGTAAVGPYPGPGVTINPQDDHGLYDRASWEVAAGTVTGYRYPTIELDLAARQSVATEWMARSDGFTGPIPPGSHIDVINVSNWVVQHPPETVPLNTVGFTERINQFQWQASLVCIPNRRYDVFKVQDSQLGRLQTGGSTLAADAPAGSTSLSIATNAGSVVWTTSATYPGDFPLYVEIDGIKVKVTAISGATSPQTFTVDGTTVAKALRAGVAVTGWRYGRIAL